MIDNPNITNAINCLKSEWNSHNIGIINEIVTLESGTVVGLIAYKASIYWGCVMIMVYYSHRPAYAVLSNGVWQKPIWL